MDPVTVLIETLWNVKAEPLQMCIVSSSFNRNIVECKEMYNGTTRGNLVGFNRNIVECKVKTGMCFITGYESFNRNIVECKVDHRQEHG